MRHMRMTHAQAMSIDFSGIDGVAPFELDGALEPWAFLY